MRVFKRGDVWFCAFYDLAGRRHRRSTRCHDRRAAEVVARRWEQAAADPAGATQAAATVEDALDLLLKLRREEAAAKKRSQETVRYYEQKTGVLVRVLGAETLLATLTAQLLDGYVTTRRREKSSEHTIHKELGALHVALRLAKRRGLWRGDLEELLPPAPVDYKPKTRFITYAEMPVLLAELDSDDSARAAFCMATSAELGATTRTTRKDLELDPIPVRGTKNSERDRKVPLVTKWQGVLLEHAKEHAQGIAGALFKNEAADFRSALKYAARRAGMAHVSPNDLRRTFSTWLRAEGVALETIAPLMGHKTTRMLELVYARLPVDLLRARLLQELGQRDTGGTDGSKKASTGETSETPKVLKLAPRAGFEPATRGLTVPFGSLPLPRDFAAVQARHSVDGTPVGRR